MCKSRPKGPDRINNYKIDHEVAMMAKGTQEFDRCIFLADTGASTHMIGDDEGLTDVTEIHEPIVIGDGKQLYATKIGRLRRTVLQTDGTTQDVVLEDVKYIPGLDMPLFAVLKSLD